MEYRITTQSLVNVAQNSTKRVSCLMWFRLLVLATFLAASPQMMESSKAADDLQRLRASIEQHCVDCHGNAGDAEAGVNLADWIRADKLTSEHALIEPVLDALDRRAMPPADASELDEPERKAMIQQLRRLRLLAARQARFEPIPIRRMNRYQYNNAVVDLLELDRDIFQLNERLMRRRDDYFHPKTGKMPDQVRVSSRPLSKDIDNQRPEGFRDVAPFPQDKRAEHGFDNRADHLSLSPLLMESFLKLGQSVAHSPDLNPAECGTWDRWFLDPREASTKGSWEAEDSRNVRIVRATQGMTRKQELQTPEQSWSRGAHLFWRCPGPGQSLELEFRSLSPASTLVLKLTRAADYGTFSIHLDGEPLVDKVDLYSPKIDVVELKIDDLEIAAGRHRITFQSMEKVEASKDHFFGVDCVELLPRPENHTSLDEQEAVRERLAAILRRAFRAPAEPEVLERFVDWVQRRRDQGASFEEAMRDGVAAVLAMPQFLYLYELDDERRANSGGKIPVSDYELATRLAQFFWSSIPDDELLDLAESGTLSAPQVLEAQIDRMLNDRKSARFCENFPGQWLQLERLITAVPDREKFPYFYIAGYRSSMHMISEPLLLFETVYVEDRSVLDLLSPDFTWQSALLKANYAGNAKAPIEVQVQTFRRVPVTDPRRGGVITNAAVMTMTSTPVRTQPITRGAWVNEVIFNDPPEPPPADVPPLPEENTKVEVKQLTIRERLAAHRERADCAGCHDKIDPLGFALENYGPTGVWRDQYENGREVDSQGTLFERQAFSDIEQFKASLVKEKRRFLRGFSAHLLSYGLGRQLGIADAPTLDAITDRADAGDDTLRSLLKQVAMSESFLHKSLPVQLDE